MNLSHVIDINWKKYRLLGNSACLTGCRQGFAKSFFFPILCIILLSLFSSLSDAAGPRPKDIYLNLGGGIFSPTFTIDPDNVVKFEDGDFSREFGVDGLPTISYLSIPLIGPVPLQVGLSGITDDPGGGTRPENRSILSLDASLGYKYNRWVGAEINIDLGFPLIQIRDVGLDDVVSSDNESTGRIHINAPDLLPIGATIFFTPVPDFIVSPYFGVGGVMVFLNNNRAHSTATEVLVVEGDVEFGWMLQFGVHLDISTDWFGFFDVKYANIDEPELETNQGTPAYVESLEFRHIRVGAGLRF